MSYQATILADSISPDGVRLTTLWVTFPRFLLAEFNTHRALSRNSNSSRAIPPERQISAVLSNPFVPETFNKRVKGMGVGEALGHDDARDAREAWLQASWQAAKHAEILMGLDCDKSRINRLLEPFLWHSAVITATEWSNFFALRTALTAQPEFQVIAKLMREAMEQSEPRRLDYGWWHLPGLRRDELAFICEVREKLIPEALAAEIEIWKRVSAGRLARWTSYDRTDEESNTASEQRCEKLISSFHMSPLEHQARPFSRNEWISAEYNQQQERERAALYDELPNEESLRMFEFRGNLRGWVQFRKEIPNEHDASLATEGGR